MTKEEKLSQRIQKKIAESKEAFSDSREFHIKYLRVVDRRPSIFCREERDSDLSKHMLHGIRSLIFPNPNDILIVKNKR